MERIAKRKIELEEESKVLEENFAKHHELEEERLKTLHQKNLQYQQDLVEQIKFQKILKANEKEEIQKEWEMTKEAEDDYHRRLQHVISNPDLKKTHPRKLLAMKLK